MNQAAINLKSLSFLSASSSNYDYSVPFFVLHWYAYVHNDPVNCVDLWGLDNYILYDPESFEKQAKAEAKRIPVTDDEETHLIPIKTESEFQKAWDNMENITDVTLIFHGSVTTINIDYKENEYLTTNPNNETPLGNSALYIGNLQPKEIETLKIYSCNGGNVSESDNVAISFSKNNNIEHLYASDGSLSFWPITYAPKKSNEGRKEYKEKYKRDPQGLIEIQQDKCSNK